MYHYHLQSLFFNVNVSYKPRNTNIVFKSPLNKRKESTSNIGEMFHIASYIIPPHVK